jgi:integrase/recombinase XerD
MPGPAAILPFQPATMATGQLAAVSFLARYTGRTHTLYAYQLREWFTWCHTHGLDPLVAVQRAHPPAHQPPLPEARRDHQRH